MKNFSALFILTLIFTAALSSGASLSPINGVVVDRNTKLPLHWHVQAQKADKATVKTILNEKGRTKAVSFAPQKARIDFFGNPMLFEKGDEFTLKVKIKGTGKVSLAYLGYRADNKFLYSTAGKTIVLDGKEQEISTHFVVTDGKEYPIAKLRASLRIMPGTVCEVSSIVLEEE